MLIRTDQSMLLLIDLQERLLPAIDGGGAVLEQAIWLTRVARRLGVPIGATVQYPQGLGPFPPALSDLLAPGESVDKIHFSAVRDECFASLPGATRPQVVVAGTEAHVCVLQTVLDLVAAGREVFVVAEAVGSRRAADKALAIERMRAAGAAIVCREMVAFEWLGRAGTPLFREVSREFLR